MASDLSILQADMVREMTGTATVERSVLSRTGGGGTTQTWSNAYTNMPCLAGPTQYPAWERDVESRVGARSYWMMTVPIGYTILPADRVITSGKTFEVTNEQGPRTISIENRILMVEIL